MAISTSKRITVSSDNRITLAQDSYDNMINIEGVDYELFALSDKGSRGGNSNVFRLKVVSEDEDYDGASEYIIKISKIPLNIPFTHFNHNRSQRFRREIIALKRARASNLENVVTFITNGDIKIGEKVFPFYIMEKGSSDLTDYLVPRRTIQQKILLFQSILEGIKQLHSIEIYHRDIKHDNIFMFGEQCKIGDLGLMRFKREDSLAIDNYQRLGAFGWESPESMNKFLTENAPNPEFTYDCRIDEASDIFQLGKLFWYILQGNLPIGCLHIDDFKAGDQDLFTVLVSLLQHGKDSGANTRRPITIAYVESLLKPLAIKYNVI